MLRSGLRVLFPFSSPSLFSFPLRLCSSSSSCRYSCLKGHTLYGTANGSTKGYLHCGFVLSPSDLWIRPRSGRENAAQIFSGSHGRVPTQTQETDDEHLSEIVSYFLSIRYFSSSEVFSVWISSSHLRRTVPGVRATGVQVDGAPPSRASLLLFSVGLREDEHCVRWNTSVIDL